MPEPLFKKNFAKFLRTVRTSFLYWAHLCWLLLFWGSILKNSTSFIWKQLWQSPLVAKIKLQKTFEKVIFKRDWEKETFWFQNSNIMGYWIWLRKKKWKRSSSSSNEKQYFSYLLLPRSSHPKVFWKKKKKKKDFKQFRRIHRKTSMSGSL